MQGATEDRKSAEKFVPQLTLILIPVHRAGALPTNENPGLATGVFCEGLVPRVLSSPLQLEELLGKYRFRRGAVV